MRISALALFSACVLAACNPSAPSGGGLFPNLTDASYRAEATISGDKRLIGGDVVDCSRPSMSVDVVGQRISAKSAARSLCLPMSTISKSENNAKAVYEWV